jgi:general secretion pathway protein E
MASNTDSSSREPAPVESLEALVARAGAVGVIQIAHAIIKQAILQGASHVTLEPRRGGGSVRYRIDGTLHEVGTLPPELFIALLSRLKVMAEMDVSEHRLPQRGRVGISTAWNQKDYDVHATTMPTLYGESVTLRLGERYTAEKWTWERLGFPEAAALQALLERRHGLILFAGPAGSGRSTALYTALATLDADTRNIVTVDEEPPFGIEGVNASAAGRPVVEAVRTLMERDTDVIAIGGVADREEVEIAVDAALTGHLVLSTFYAEDAIHALERLMELDIAPSELGTALAGIVASRLVRRLCPECKEAYEPEEEEVRGLGVAPDAAGGWVFYRAAGCEHCHGVGYRGRTGLYELLRFDEATARLVEAGLAGVDALREHLRQSGFRSLQDEGVRKVREGVTTVEEVLGKERLA